MSVENSSKGIITSMKEDLVIHRGAYIRMTLYMVAALLTDLFSRLGTLTDELVQAMRWWDWTVLWGSPLLAAILIWRSFLDSSLADSKKAADAANATAKPKDGEPVSTQEIGGA